jgi:hypothetical protein
VWGDAEEVQAESASSSEVKLDVRGSDLESAWVLAFRPSKLDGVPDVQIQSRPGDNKVVPIFQRSKLCRNRFPRFTAQDHRVLAVGRR